MPEFDHFDGIGIGQGFQQTYNAITSGMAAL
jgi:hypothetical protein